jgi:uncharacterized membrane protein YeaQ/YmgE (transglycosylase-associated protein family)
MSIAEDAELLAGSAGAVVPVDQIMKTMQSEDHKTEHLSQAARGAAIAISTWELLRRQESHHHHAKHHHSVRPIESPEPEHHKLHIGEQILGAYGVGKELTGDNIHHLLHLLQAVIGAVG